MIPLHFRPARPGELNLEEGVVHLWRCSLAKALEDGLELLSPQERQRSEAVASPDRRQRLVASRSQLRRLLGAYLGRAPRDLPLITSANGRPDLATGAVEGEFSFNVSHSGEMLVIALARCPALGVDIERLKPRRGMQRLLSRCFSEEERRRLQALPEDQRLEAFYRGWTRKEALLKAQGLGVFQGAATSEVELNDAVTPRVRSVCGDRNEARRWKLLGLRPSAEAVGAIALPARDWRLVLLEEPS